MQIVNNSLISSEVGRNVFGGRSRASDMFRGSYSNPLDRSQDIKQATILFSSGGLARVLIRALPTGQYAGERGNYISAVMYRVSANRFAFQMFTRDGSQINGNVIDAGGMAAAVAKFNADADLNSDFEAIALTADVDVAFSAGTGYANSTRLTGGEG